MVAIFTTFGEAPEGSPKALDDRSFLCRNCDYRLRIEGRHWAQTVKTRWPLASALLEPGRITLVWLVEMPKLASHIVSTYLQAHFRARVVQAFREKMLRIHPMLQRAKRMFYGVAPHLFDWIQKETAVRY